MHRLRQLRSDEGGSILVIALAVLLIVLTLSTGIVLASINANTTSSLDNNRSRALAAADAGLAAADQRLSRQPVIGSGNTSAILGQCFTTSFVAQDSSGNCTAQTDSLSSGGSYTYYVSPDMSASNWTNHTTSSCTGYPVTAPSGVDISQRCITAIGTYNGQSARVEERVVDYKTTALVNGLESLSNMLFDTNGPTHPYDGCTQNTQPPCPPVYLSGNFYANGTITIQGNTWTSGADDADVINGTVQYGPSGSVSYKDPTYNCPAAGSSASTTAYTGQTVSCTTTQTTSNFSWAAGATLSDYTSTATSNNDSAINTANPTISPAPYTASSRAFSAGGTSSNPVIIPSGVYNFCSFSVNGGYVKINSGSNVIIYVDNSKTGDGCPTGGSDGQVNMPTAGFINNNSDPHSLIINVCGYVPGSSGACGSWSVGAPCSGGASCGTYPGTLLATTDGSTWSQQNSVTNNNLLGIDCASTTVCETVGASGAIVGTTNGGTSWAVQTSGSTAQLNGVSCASTSFCVAVGAATGGPGGKGTILYTTNGGSTWTSVAGPNNNNIDAVSCPSTTTCFAVDNKGGIDVTTNGGSTWSTQTSHTTQQLYGVSCASTSFCVAVGQSKTIDVTSNGGTTWSASNVGSNNWKSVSCPSTTTCFAVDDRGLIYTTTNGATSWSAQTSFTTQQLNAISCTSATSCWAVGNSPGGGQGGVMGATSNGTSWSSGTDPFTQPLLGVDCVSSTVCYAVGNAGGNISSQSIGLITLNDDLNSTGGPAGNGMTYGYIYAPDSALTTTGNGLRWTGGIIIGNWESNDNDFLGAAPGYTGPPSLDFYPVAYHRCSTYTGSGDQTANGCY